MRAFIASHGHLIVLAPLAGALLNGLAGRRLLRLGGERLVGLVACGAVALSFLLALFAIGAVRAGGAVLTRGYTWIDAGGLRADAALLFDPLSAIMILVVSGVGLLIHVYSTAYLHGDPGFPRFFASLNLFVFSMLVLVLAENALLMFVGWEGVGLCSYLLIGFWFGERENVRAANKAFIVNRIGDLGLITGLFLLYWLVRDAGVAAGGGAVLSFGNLQAQAPLLQGARLFGASAVTVVCVALFLGATGKSAQIPLYVWLPDAMAGPTPVSALIHAATMVTAGVYLIGRLHFLFAMSPAALALVAGTGAATALLAATVGCVQNDIKKILAYSTISQLGVMVTAMGVGAYPAGIFHLVTHAFFKAGLFLGAGSVILGTHHEQDIRRMGGLRRAMPLTFGTFVVAAAALAGVPPLAGFFSKDEILWLVFNGGHGHPVLGLAGLATAALTAFYMTRLIVRVFFGEWRGAAGHGLAGVKESPHAITVPLLALAALAALAGFAGVPEALGGSNAFGAFLGGVFGAGHAGGGPVVPGHGAPPLALMAASVALAAAGAAAAVVCYHARPDLPDRLARRFGRLYRLVSARYHVDELYDAVFVRGTLLISRLFAGFDRYVVDQIVKLGALAVRAQAAAVGWFDLQVVDRLVDLVADAVRGAGDGVRRLQTGRVQSYLVTLLLIVTAALAYTLFAIGGVRR